MNIVQWIAAKRDGQRLSDDRIAAIIGGYANGSVPEYQMSALAMAILWRGMDDGEVVALTRAMRDSGDTLSWPDLDCPVVDKHSTGGIGDKVSLILAPLLAAEGLAVPMISGRGLGATGGTLDKFESIPGLTVDLSMDAIRRQVRDVGCVIAGASAEIAPADRRLYALRDVTATVPSIPLITASILAKKLAAGLDALVLDVKTGSGAFMKQPEQARRLAATLVQVASQLGVPTSALVTDMNQPLGRMAGNANEVNESVQVLQGGGPPDVRELTLQLGTELIGLIDAAPSRDVRRGLESSLDSGRAMEVFESMVAAQGGTWSGPLPCAAAHDLPARQAGYVASMDAEQLGWSIIEIGGGRKRLDDSLDRSTGLEMLVRIGDRVERGQPLMRAFCDVAGFERIRDHLYRAVKVVDQECECPRLVIDRVSSAISGEPS
jgi:pyrimidine-nucleoside phosphorylase